VISGRAKLDLEGQTLNLKAGDSWLVPAGATHEYTIIEPFTAVEEQSVSGIGCVDLRIAVQSCDVLPSFK
jgi:hypothetical protein